MMRRLDTRGAAALEFTFIGAMLFTLMILVIDLARYAITAQSLQALANAEARAIIVGCYTPDVDGLNGGSPVSPLTNCTQTTYQLSNTAAQNAAPYLWTGGLTPTVSVTKSSNALTITASQPLFVMLLPIWGASLNAPSASASIPSN